MEAHRHLPERGKFSTVMACILVCYTFMPFVHVAQRVIAFTVFGVFISFQLDFYNLISLITAILAAAGMDWMLEGHPHRENKPVITHLILPALTAGALGFPLGLIQQGPAWWIILALGSLLVVLVLISEYISLEPGDNRYPLALMVLSGTSFSLLLILSIALRSSGLRLYMLLLMLPAFFAFFSMRVLHFRLGGRWRFEWGAVITLVVTQILIALYYWPVSPVRFGLLLVGPAYAMVGVAASLEENPDWRSVFLEPLIVLGLMAVLAVFIG